MISSFSAEVLKLRKRPATWVLGAVSVASVVAFYLLVYFVAPESSGAVRSLLPQNMPAAVLPLVSGFGGPIALILGAMTVGSEYGWDTLKVALPRRQNRLSLLTGKLLAVGVALAVLSVVMLLAGAALSYLVAALSEAAVEWPSFGEVLTGLGAAWLVLAAWGTLGAFLATLLRGTTSALGLGLVYALVLESVIHGLQSLNESFKTVSEALIGTNSTELANSAVSGAASVSKSGGLAISATGDSASTSDPTQAALVLGAYLAGSVLLAVLLFWRRDVN